MMDIDPLFRAVREAQIAVRKAFPMLDNEQRRLAVRVEISPDIAIQLRRYRDMYSFYEEASSAVPVRRILDADVYSVSELETPAWRVKSIA